MVELGAGEMGTDTNGHQGKWTFEEKGNPKCPNTPVPISSQVFLNGQRVKWALEKMNIWGKEYSKCPMPVSLKCLQMGTRAYGHLGPIDFWEKGVGNLKCLVSISPKCLQGTLGRWALGANKHLGICPKCPFAPLPICKSLGEMGTGRLWYPVRALKVPLSDKCPSAHLPWCPYANIWEMDTGHLGYPFRKFGVAYPFRLNINFPKCPFAPVLISPGAHLDIQPQILIFLKSQFAQVPIYFRAHLPRVLFYHLPGVHLL